MSIESVAGDPEPRIVLSDAGLVSPAAPLVVRSTSSATEVRVEARGEVDISTAALLRVELADALRTADSVVVDLTDVTFMDSQGLRVLIEARVAAEDRPFVVAAASPNVRRLIRVSGLDESFGMSAELR